MKPKYNKKDIITTAVFSVLFIVCLSVMLYPTFSNWWNSNMASHTISRYQEEVANIDTGEYDEALDAAKAYNEQLYHLHAPFSNYDALSGYSDLLNISGTGIIGYVSIPKIKVELPIYHGTDESSLQIASGHIQGSSLPVGGENTHAVISGHRGLPSARLFTNLDQIVEGDTFTINVLNEVLTYEVEKILVILPNDTSALEIVPGKDMVTLMTCTPYGVNSHRLLVMGHRIKTVYDKKIKVGADALQIDQLTVMVFVFVLLMICILVYWRITGNRHKNIKIDKYTIRDLPKQD